MDKVYSNYYHDLYRQTAGFIPLVQQGEVLYPGDFFQIRNREIVVLGNIYLNQLIAAENCSIGDLKQLNPINWNLQSGISKPYSGRGSGDNSLDGNFEYSRQIIAFAERGSYLFKAEAPESVAIANWRAIADELIIKLTQTHFSFREVYIVTESVTTASWTLAVAGAEKAELEIATEEENFGLQDVFGNASAKTIQSKEMEYYHREDQRKPQFFKAKKLEVREEKFQPYVSDLANHRESIAEWASNFYDYPFAYHPSGVSPLVSVNAGTHVLDLLAAGDLNPNTALDYFHWSETKLDDVHLLFYDYE